MLARPRRWLSQSRSRWSALFVTIVVTAVAAGLLTLSLDRDAFARSWDTMTADLVGVVLSLAAFATAFLLRTFAWRRVLPEIGFAQAWSGIHVSLGANHFLPLRLGEPLRVASVVRRTKVGVDAALASTVVLRAADIATVVGIGWLIAPRAFTELVGNWGWLLGAIVVLLGVLSASWLRTLARSRPSLRLPDASTFALTSVAWAFEAVLVWHAARWAGIDLSAGDAMLVTTVAVAAQVAAIAPGGFGTYEAASVAAYVALGHDAELGLVAALTAHALKTSYSLVSGAVAVFLPAPSLVGRLRLDAAAPRPLATSAIDPDAPVVLFMPALDEEAAVGRCIRRAPVHVLGHRVHTVVVDDGSTDRTADVARAAGAEVLSFDETRGLGAGVREGLRHATELGAAAVAFCDADEEYPPEELENLVRPILDGSADYVIGSRFAGTIEHMRPHRRLGNIVLTKLMCFITRRRITDAQSGYRAFSRDAAARAEVIHDFNYAQVLTLDLLAKGYRYHEVPITYRFRTSGESFIKLGGYLRRVVPAVYRELNAA